MRQRRIDANLCVGCGKIPPFENKRECQNCAAKRKKRQWSEYNSETYTRNKHKLKEKVENLKSQGICIRCKWKKCEEADKTTCNNCLAKQRELYEKRKDLIFNHYGGYKCACCGESNKKFLTLDHINNDGAAHRKLIKHNDGRAMFIWIMKNGFPPIFQILCYNCNCGKNVNGGICPHKTQNQNT